MSTLDLQTLFRRADTVNGRNQVIENWSVKKLTHTLAEIKADGYLDAAVNEFSVADRVSVTGSDGSEELIITTINASAPRVITAAFSGLAVPEDNLIIGDANGLPVPIPKADLINGHFFFEASFEAGELIASGEIWCASQDLALVGIRATVTKQLVTNSGLFNIITPAVTGTPITITTAETVGNVIAGAITGTNTVNKGDFIEIATTSAGALGGRVWVEVEWRGI